MQAKMSILIEKIGIENSSNVYLKWKQWVKLNKTCYVLFYQKIKIYRDFQYAGKMTHSLTLGPLSLKRNIWLINGIN
jgi:hypothetical protein